MTHSISNLPAVDEIFVIKDGYISEAGSFTELGECEVLGVIDNLVMSPVTQPDVGLHLAGDKEEEREDGHLYAGPADWPLVPLASPTGKHVHVIHSSAFIYYLLLLPILLILNPTLPPLIP